ncbi:MAG TPA: GNAT family N-acetyltransferase [Caldilinea sp.]|nr:GNAT family N-acetyltransferase [Caldilinea sp.]
MSLAIRWPKRMRSTFKTRTGEVLTLRLMKPSDAELLEKLFYQLSPESRWRRFHMIIDHLPPQEVLRRARELTNVDNRTLAGAIIALAGAGESSEIVGVVRLARPVGQPDATEAEAAIVIRDDYQRQGIGKELLQRMVVLARRMKVKRILAVFQPDNEVAIRMFRQLGLPRKLTTSHGASKMYLEAPE